MESILLIWMMGPHSVPNIAGLSNLIMHRYLRKGINTEIFLYTP